MKLLHDIPEASNLLFTIYHLDYKEKLGIIKSIYNLFLFWLPPKVLLLVDVLFYYTVKIIATYHLNYKDRLIDNLSIVFLFTYNSRACNTKPNLVTRKKEILKTFLHFFLTFSHFCLLCLA